MEFTGQTDICRVNVKLAFGLIMCARDLQQAEDAGHSSQARVGVGMLQAGHCTL